MRRRGTDLKLKTNKRYSRVASIAVFDIFFIVLFALDFLCNAFSQFWSYFIQRVLVLSIGNTYLRVSVL